MCDSPYYSRKYTDLKHIPLPCGKCPVCKRRRVNQWAFRLQQEEKVSSNAYFITLTYDTSQVPITPNGYMSLSKRDVQLFIKRLRKLNGKTKVVYYLAGEYGEKFTRPHYHAILFNINDINHVGEAWNLGQVHIGHSVSGASFSYTAKYIDKASRIPLHARDDRQKEFSHMSKGIGKNYMTPQVVAYHKSNKDHLFVQEFNGNTLPIPRYYRLKMFNKRELLDQQVYIAKQLEVERQKKALLFAQKGKDLDQVEQSEKMQRLTEFYKRQNLER